MPDVLTYVLHYEGAFNKNSLGAVSEGAARAQEIGGECHAVVVGEEGSRVQCGDFHDPAAKPAGQIIEDEDTDDTVAKIVAWLDERNLI